MAASVLARPVLKIAYAQCDPVILDPRRLDAVATIVSADVTTTWNALMELDLIEVGRKRPVVAILGALRALRAARSPSEWTFGVGSGAHVLVQAVIDTAREIAERHRTVAEN